MRIRAYLLDTRTRPHVRRLTLYFDNQHRPVLPSGAKEPIVLDFGTGRWNGTMNSVSPNNAPYVHDRLTNTRGGEFGCTQVFSEMGLAAKDELEFELIDKNYFLLVK